MLETLTYEELCENIAYYSQYPFSEDRADIRNAHICLTLASLLDGKHKYKLEDFMLKFESKESKKQTWDQQYNDMLSFTKSYEQALKTQKGN